MVWYIGERTTTQLTVLNSEQPDNSIVFNLRKKDGDAAFSIISQLDGIATETEVNSMSDLQKLLADHFATETNLQQTINTIYKNLFTVYSEWSFEKEIPAKLSLRRSSDNTHLELYLQEYNKKFGIPTHQLEGSNIGEPSKSARYYHLYISAEGQKYYLNFTSLTELNHKLNQMPSELYFNEAIQFFISDIYSTRLSDIVLSQLMANELPTQALQRVNQLCDKIIHSEGLQEWLLTQFFQPGNFHPELIDRANHICSDILERTSPDNSLYVAACRILADIFGLSISHHMNPALAYQLTPEELEHYQIQQVWLTLKFDPTLASRIMRQHLSGNMRDAFIIDFPAEKLDSYEWFLTFWKTQKENFSLKMQLLALQAAQDNKPQKMARSLSLGYITRSKKSAAARYQEADKTTNNGFTVNLSPSFTAQQR